ncbi:MAG: hypothetical protein U1E65_26965 [Myxococcota bacterium]
MSRFSALLLLGLLACSKNEPIAPTKPIVRLSREVDGRVRVETSGFSGPISALELDLAAEGDTVVMDGIDVASGAHLDTARLKMHGAQHAILFASDKRGAKIAPSGSVVVFAAHDTAGSATAPNARVYIERAVVLDTEGKRVDVDLGVPLALR